MKVCSREVVNSSHPWKTKETYMKKTLWTTLFRLLYRMLYNELCMYMCNTINYLQLILQCIRLLMSLQITNGTLFVPQFREVGANRSTTVHSRRPMETAPKGASMCGWWAQTIWPSIWRFNPCHRLRCWWHEHVWVFLESIHVHLHQLWDGHSHLWWLLFHIWLHVFHVKLKLLLLINKR